MNHLRSILADERRKAGFTQEEVARALGITRTAYVRYETGSRTPDVDVALRISRIIGKDVALLFAHDVPNGNNHEPAAD